MWKVNDIGHRLEGPSHQRWLAKDIIFESWWYERIEYNKEKHPFNIFRLEYDLPENYEEWDDEYKALLKLTYC